MSRPELRPATCLSLLLAAIVLFLSGALPAAAQTSLTPSFDWQMPARLTVDDIGRVKNFTEPGEVSPGNWPIHFDACSSSGPVSTYEWAVDGTTVGESSSCAGFTHAFPTEGTYEVSLTVHADEGTTPVTTRRDVVVEDFLIVAIGDSYASGEGNPDIPIPTDAWSELVSLAEDLSSKFQERETAKDALISREQALEDAQQVYEKAVAAVQALLAELNALLAEMSTVAAKYEAVQDAQAAVDAARTHRNDVCPFPVADCAAAEAALRQRQTELAARQAELAAELARVGFASFSEYETYFEQTRAALEQDLGELQQARSAAQSLLDEARDRMEEAAELVEQLRQAIEAVRDALLLASDDVQPTWGTTDEDRRCHRSSASGQVQAALQLERADPKTSVTLMHLACSGATIEEGLIGFYGGVEGGSNDIAPQVIRARTLAGVREVDAVIISIGGNDIKFGPLVEKCMIEEPCFDPEADPQYALAREAAVLELCGMLPGAVPLPDGELPVALPYQLCINHLMDPSVPAGSATELFDEAFELLAGRYDSLRAKLEAHHPDLPADRVYITEYPDLTKDEQGGFCGFDPDDDAASRMLQLPGLSQPEFIWADQGPLFELNGAIAEAARTHGWQVVDGIYDPFAQHGYCSAESWVVRIQESLPQQKDQYGTMHPTTVGQYTYRDQIYEALAADLMSGGPGDPGALPNTPMPIDPENGSTAAAGDVTLKWHAASDAATYDVQVAVVEDFSETVVDESGLADTTFVVPGTSDGTTYFWRVRGVNDVGAGAYSETYSFAVTTSSVAVDDTGALPEQFALLPNYPNPFNPQTTIRYALSEAVDVRLVVFDLLGREVERLVNQRQPAGRYEFVFNAAGLGSGVFFYRLDAGDFAQTRRMTLIK